MKVLTHHLVTTTPVARTVCDLCRELVSENRIDSTGEATLKIVTGDQGDGTYDSSLTEEADVCGRCFRTHVMPTLALQGVVFHSYRTEEGRVGTVVQKMVKVTS